MKPTTYMYRLDASAWERRALERAGLERRTPERQAPASPVSPRVRLEIEVLSAPEPVRALFSRLRHVPAQRRILVVSLDAEIRRYVQECLRDHPFVRCTEASWVGEAIERMRDEAPHLVVSDLSDVATSAAFADVRVVLISDVVPLEPLPGPARVSYLERPFSAGVVVDAVERALREEGTSS